MTTTVSLQMVATETRPIRDGEEAREITCREGVSTEDVWLRSKHDSQAEARQRHWLGCTFVARGCGVASIMIARDVHDMRFRGQIEVRRLKTCVCRDVCGYSG